MQLESDGVNIPHDRQRLLGSYMALGGQVFLSQNMSLRIEAKNTVYRARYLEFTSNVDNGGAIEITGKSAPVWRNQTQVMFGLSYLFGKGE